MYILLNNEQIKCINNNIDNNKLNNIITDGYNIKNNTIDLKKLLEICNSNQKLIQLLDNKILDSIL